MNANAANLIDRIALIAGPAAVIAFAAWFSSWNGDDQPSAGPEAARVVITSAPIAAAWLIAAIGLGWILRRVFASQSNEDLAIQLGVGVAAMLFLDATLGTLGWLQIGGGVVAWIVIAIGLILALAQFARWLRTKPDLNAPPWLIWCAAPAVAVLLIAACSAPGWLWATEFGGYDALSYHLQLPKEWIAGGLISPLQHNVYSYLPDYMEAAFYHIALMRGDAIESAYACQLLHAAIALATAYTLGKYVSVICNRTAGIIAAALLIGTPWTVVAGSLAYDEMPALLMLATSLCLITDQSLHPFRRGVLIGFCAGVACGAKLTSVGFVAAPIGLLLLMDNKVRTWPSMIAGTCFTALLVLLPWLIRNQISAGNPVFPFAASLFGSGHWSHEQLSIWHDAHMPAASMTERALELWNQILRFGIGVNPNSPEPWKPQWSMLPWLALIGWIISLTRQATRRSALRLGLVLIAQLGFWMMSTHMKSRFFLPAAIPMCVLAALGISALTSLLRINFAHEWMRISIAAMLLAWCIVPILIFHNERNGAPASAIGEIGVFTGDAIAPSQRADAGTSLFPSIAVNYLLNDHDRVLAIGYATPFYMRDKISYTTTWDRGPLSQLMREFPNQPNQWAKHLRDMGFTHLIVDETMLAVWERSHWNDPLLSVSRVDAFAHQAATPLYRYQNGVTIYKLD